MRILVITEEDEFYLPLAVGVLLDNVGDEIVEVVCARNPLLPSMFKTARKFYGTFGLLPILSQGFRVFKAKILDKFGFLNYTGRFFSIERLCKFHNIPYRYADNINSLEFLEHCRDLNIDLIASVSPTQIFKEEIIDLPKYGCLNIHTAELPKYRGLYPTFWAMSCGEKKLGISIHYIEQGIDTGKILLQDKVDIPPRTTMHHMLTVTKQKGAELLAKAIGQIGEGTVQAHYAEGEGSYFSFPTPESYRQFRKNGYKLW